MTAPTPRYILFVGAGESGPVLVAEDEESQRALFNLIEQGTGLDKATAEAALNSGKMIVGAEVIVVADAALRGLRR